MKSADVAPFEISALIFKLQETAEALLAFCHAVSANSKSPESDAKYSEQTYEFGKKQLPGEYKMYHLDANTLCEEAELFEHYERDSLAGVLSYIHAELYITVFMLKGYDGEKKLDSFHLGLLAEHFERPLDMLSKAWSVLEGFSQVPSPESGHPEEEDA